MWRVLDEEKSLHARPRLLDHWTVRAEFLSISRRECAAGLRFGWPRLHFNETHAAIARDGQPLMLAEARNFLARQLTCLKHGRACGAFQFYTIDGSFRHDLLRSLHHRGRALGFLNRSEEHTSELQSLMRTSYAGLCLQE